jgi:hypothetical protein
MYFLKGRPKFQAKLARWNAVVKKTSDIHRKFLSIHGVDLQNRRRTLLVFNNARPGVRNSDTNSQTLFTAYLSRINAGCAAPLIAIFRADDDLY